MQVLVDRSSLHLSDFFSMPLPYVAFLLTEINYLDAFVEGIGKSVARSLVVFSKLNLYWHEQPMTVFLLAQFWQVKSYGLV